MKGDIIHVKERTQSIEANTEMFQVFELPGRDFRETMVNIWKGWLMWVNRWVFY